MNKSDEMRSQLAALNLYNLNGSSLIDYELESYGAALDGLQSRLDALRASLWVSSAGEEILSLWEQRLGFCPEGGVETRRRKILRRLQNNKASDYTRDGIEDYLHEAGFTGFVINDFNNLNVRLFSWADNLSIEYFVPFVKLARDVVPAHIQLTVELPQEDWNQTDSRDYDFDRWDAMSLHWDVNWTE